MIVPKEMILPLRAKALAARLKGGRRGGGKASSACSVLGGRTATGDDKASLRGLTASKPKKSAGSVLGGLTAASAVSDRLGGLTATFSNAPKRKHSVSGKSQSLGGYTKKTHLKQGSPTKVPSDFGKHNHVSVSATHMDVGSPSKHRVGFGLSKRTMSTVGNSPISRKRALLQDWNKRQSDKKTGDANSIDPTFAVDKMGRVRKTQHTWTCPLCQMVLVSDAPNSLHSKRYSHLKPRHPDEDRTNRATHMKEYIDVVVAGADLPHDQRD